MRIIARRSQGGNYTRAPARRSSGPSRRTRNDFENAVRSPNESTLQPGAARKAGTAVLARDGAERYEGLAPISHRPTHGTTVPS